MCQFCNQRNDFNDANYLYDLPSLEELIQSSQAALPSKPRRSQFLNTEDAILRTDLVQASGGRTIRGTRNNDRLTGTSEQESILGLAGNDTLRGGGGHDSLNGGSGNDTLNGGSGNDTLNGGTGVNRLVGGAGADQFNFQRNDGREAQIQDFQSGTDHLLINQRGFDLSLRAGNLNDIRFKRGTQATTRSQRFIYQRSTGNLYFDPDGSGREEKVRIAKFKSDTRLVADDIKLSGNHSSSSDGSGAPSPPQDPFDIDLNFQSTTLSQTQRNIINRAAQRWENIFAEGLPEARRQNGEVIDDLKIDMVVRPIDGVGGTLGQAGPRAIRTQSSLPFLGLVELDQADVNQLQASGTLEDFMTHEIGHVLGFGTLWSGFNLIQGEGSNNPRYTGRAAVRAYNRIFNENVSSIPLENSGGSGTRNSHWRESVFDNELMTGVIRTGNNPLSEISIASLADLGYQVNLNQADPFG